MTRRVNISASTVSLNHLIDLMSSYKHVSRGKKKTREGRLYQGLYKRVAPYWCEINLRNVHRGLFTIKGNPWWYSTLMSPKSVASGWQGRDTTWFTFSKKIVYISWSVCINLPKVTLHTFRSWEFCPNQILENLQIVDTRKVHSLTTNTEQPALKGNWMY